MLIIIFAIIGASVSWTVSDRKGHNPLGWAILGFFLPLIGMLVACCLADRRVEALVQRNAAGPQPINASSAGAPPASWQ